jgi:hypothetical protein
MFAGSNRRAGAVIFAKRSSDGNSGTERQRQYRATTRWLVEAFLSKMGEVAWLFPIRGSLYSPRPISVEIGFGRRLLAALLFAVSAVSMGSAATAADYVDISLRTGAQLEGRFKQALGDANVIAALDYEKLQPDIESLTDYQFRSTEKNQRYDMFFIPLKGGDDGLQHFVLLAKNLKGERVYTARVAVQPKEQPQVKDEHEVVDGKVTAGKGSLRAFFKCTAEGCVPLALGCTLGGPSWLPCFCLGCAGSVAVCGVEQLFFPD